MGERATITGKMPSSKGGLFTNTRKNNLPKQDRSPRGQILHLQRTMGNQAVQRLLKSGTLQAKLTIGQSNDKYEQEADRVADKVMRMPEPGGRLAQRKTTCPECPEKEEIQTKPLAEQITPVVQRETEEEEQIQPKSTCPECPEKEEPIQAKQGNNLAPAVTSTIESGVHSLKGGGQPLPETTRSYFEPRFGTDFSQVRVHTDSQAAETAQSINSKAFTTGKHVVFGTGQYSPVTSVGKKLLAHELTHLVQQTTWEKPIIQRQEGAERTVPRRTAAVARTDAAAALDIAINRVSEAINNIHNAEPIPEDVRCAFERFFPGESLEFLPLLLRRIEAARGIVETVRIEYVTSVVSVAVNRYGFVINLALNRGDVPAMACPQEHYIVVFRPFYLRPELQATRLIHELYEYYYHPMMINSHNNPRVCVWSYQGFVSQLGGLNQVIPLEIFPSVC